MVELFKELVTNYGISQCNLAERIGLHDSTFRNKLSGKNNRKFTKDELFKIRAIVFSMSSDLGEIVKKIATENVL